MNRRALLGSFLALPVAARFRPPPSVTRSLVLYQRRSQDSLEQVMRAVAEEQRRRSWENMIYLPAATFTVEMG